MKTPTNLTGRVFGRLTASSISGRNKSGKVLWMCTCNCGNVTCVTSQALVSKATQSCGCLHKEGLVDRLTTHGLTDSSENQIWRAIKKRCYNEKHQQYKDYGGRGITMCDEWKESFEAFYRDMGARPSLDYTIDRKDNDLGYSKENCRWATRKEQNNNRRGNVYYEFDGEKKTLAEWCSELNLPYQRMYKLLKRGLSFEDSADKVIKSYDSNKSIRS